MSFNNASIGGSNYDKTFQEEAERKAAEEVAAQLAEEEKQRRNEEKEEWRKGRIILIILPQIKSKYVIPSPLHIHLLLESGCLLYDVFINRICNETFGTPLEGITLITLLNRSC